MALRLKLAMFLTLLFAPALAGCDFQDWYNQEGYIRVHLQPQGPTNSSLSDFSKLKLAVYGVSVKQVGFIEPKSFSFGAQPLVVDFIDAGAKGAFIPLADLKSNIRPIESITLTVDIVEAVDAQGKTIPVCREGQTVTTFPCFFLAKNGSITFDDRNIAMERGGRVNFGFPIAIKKVTQQGDTEYFLLTDQSLAIIDIDP